MAKDAARAKVRKREKKNITSGVAHVNASFNNTMITITDAQGNALAWSSSGTMGFKGSRKSTPYAAQVAAEDVSKKAQEHGMITDTMSGVPVLKAYNSKDKSGTLIVALGKNAMLNLAYQGISEEEVLQLSEKFDWKAMQAAVAK